jgi:hypothetical protein
MYRYINRWSTFKPLDLMGPYCVLASFSGPGLCSLCLAAVVTRIKAAVEADGESLGARAFSGARERP